MADKEDPVIIKMPSRDWRKIMAYCRAANPDEIIGVAHGEIMDGTIHVSNPMILEQEVASASCDVLPAACAKFIGEYPDIAKVKVVWHSHVDMGVKFSGTDRDTSSLLGALGAMTSGPNSWWVSLVVNLSQDYSAVVDIASPFKATLPCIIHFLPDEDREAAEEVKRLVKKKTYSYWPASQSEFGKIHNLLDSKEAKSLEEDVFGQFNLDG
jgi:proteasome lid subunit RPN8/RPN11